MGVTKSFYLIIVYLKRLLGLERVKWTEHFLCMWLTRVDLQRHIISTIRNDPWGQRDSPSTMGGGCHTQHLPGMNLGSSLRLLYGPEPASSNF